MNAAIGNDTSNILQRNRKYKLTSRYRPIPLNESNGFVPLTETEIKQAKN